MGAYEAMWLDEGATFKTIADKFRANSEALPSDFVPVERAKECALNALRELRSAHVTNFGVRIHGAGEYPQKLRDARHPVELLYFQGWWDLVETPSVAVVGTREPSDEGCLRTKRLTRMLVHDGFTIVSGLAKGVDTVAHETALAEGGRTVAVLGTPLSRSYPKENVELQRRIGEKFLLISQVPMLRYMQAKDPRANSYFFPERNVTMSALTLATIIVEAGETSGTLYQARAALAQKRKLFILDSCFQTGLRWPQRFAELGAVRVRDYDDIRTQLADSIAHTLDEN
jgi:DNA processing protein